MRYKPAKISNTAVTTSITLRPGGVTRYNPAGGITLTFPLAPEPHDTITIKNSTADPATVTLNPNGKFFEPPNLNDTTYVTGSNVQHSGPKQSHRWIYDGVDTWWIDHSYKPNEARSVLIANQATYTLKRPGEIVLVNSSTGPVDITVPQGWPDDSKFTVTKISVDQNLVTVTTSGAEQIENVRFSSGVLTSSVSIIDNDESFSYIKHGQAYYAYSHSVSEYGEVFQFLGPANITDVLTLVPIDVDANITGQSLLFTNAGGLLTAISDVTLIVDMQVLLMHYIGANNGDVYSQVILQTNSTDVANTLVPIQAAFSHSRASVPSGYGDTRNSQSFVRLQAGNTIGIYSQEIESTGASNTDIEGLLAVFRIVG